MRKVLGIVNTRKRDLGYFIITLLSIFLLVYFVDFRLAGEVLYEADWLLVFLALFISLVVVVIRFLRLKLILDSVVPLSLYYLAGLGFVSGLLGMIIPYSGGVAMSYYVAKESESSYKKVFSIFFFEYLFSFFMAILLGLVGLFYFIHKKMLFYDFSFEMMIAWAVLFILAIGVIFFVLKKIFYKKYLLMVDNFVIYKSQVKKRVFPFFLFTVVIFVTSMFQVVILYRAFGMSPNVLDLIMAVNMLGVIIYLPGIFMKIGHEEAVGVVLLPMLLGLDKNAVFSLIFVNRVLMLVVSVVLGILFMYLLKVDLGVLRSIEKKGVRSKLLYE